MNSQSTQYLWRKVRTWQLNRLNKELACSFRSKAQASRSLDLLNQRARAEKSLIEYTRHPGLPDVYIVRDKRLGQSRLVSSLQRCQWLYQYGFADRFRQIGSSYCLDKVSFSPGDIVVDCGANYGDLHGYLKSRIDGCLYIALEPSRTDYLCLKSNLNAHDDIALNIALGEADGDIDLYEDVEYANSSVVPPPSYSRSYQVKMMKLASALKTVGFQGKRIKLFKVEAEGYEPEICYGASDCLELIDYIAIDVGFERGINQESTAPSVINYLTSRHFVVCDVGPLAYGLRLLFKNSIPAKD